ncbi:hypothetical protein [Apilactobacillus micheneri]|uniref:hypothetical protein n=1 Tax=Apilactobacillus micheneri TaxID=1899430 RepID=UPI000D51858D|nr:hypothetical protein [Apilactobacillus micheneri]GAY79938.1 hypothetical protein NBRC113063_00802 [Apilactobacillus micheneri]
MKWNKLLFSLILILGIGIFATNTTANASSWHKGTPKFVRGSWKDFSKSKKYEPYEMAANNNRVAMWDSINPYLLSTKTHYKYLGHNKYYCEGIPGGQGEYGGKSIFIIKKKNNNSFSLTEKYVKFPYSQKESKKEMKYDDGNYIRIHSNKLKDLGAF